MDIDNLCNNDIIMLSLVTDLNSSTAQEIVKCVTTADGCVHTADTTQLDLANLLRLVETVANYLRIPYTLHTGDAIQLDS